MTECTEIQKLQKAVYDMDALSHCGFSEIASLAKLALAALEVPETYRHLENIANVLNTIWGIAEGVENDINCEAEAVGFNYRDERSNLRFRAYRAHSEATPSVVGRFADLGQSLPSGVERAADLCHGLGNAPQRVANPDHDQPDDKEEKEKSKHASMVADNRASCKFQADASVEIGGGNHG